MRAASSAGFAEPTNVRDHRGSMMALVNGVEGQLCALLKQIRGLRELMQDSYGQSGHGPWRRERDCHSLGWFEECQCCGFVRRA